MNKSIKNQEEKVVEIAKIVINKCLSKGYNINAIKLQQILTLIQGTMLARHNKTFFSQDIYNLEVPTIIEVHKAIETAKISLEENKTEYILSLEEESIVQEIIDRFGIYNYKYLKTSFVFNVLDKIRTKEKAIIHVEYLKMVFLEFGFDNITKQKMNIAREQKTNERFINFAEKYDNLISHDFPRKWLPEPETGYAPSKHDLLQLVETVAENGFVENYCLDANETKQLRLIRYYRNNYNSQD